MFPAIRSPQPASFRRHPVPVVPLVLSENKIPSRGAQAKDDEAFRSPGRRAPVSDPEPRPRLNRPTMPPDKSPNRESHVDNPPITRARSRMAPGSESQMTAGVCERRQSGYTATSRGQLEPGEPLLRERSLSEKGTPAAFQCLLATKSRPCHSDPTAASTPTTQPRRPSILVCQDVVSPAETFPSNHHAASSCDAIPRSQ